MWIIAEKEKLMKNPTRLSLPKLIYYTFFSGGLAKEQTKERSEMGITIDNLKELGEAMIKESEREDYARQQANSS